MNLKLGLKMFFSVYRAVVSKFLLGTFVFYFLGTSFSYICPSLYSSIKESYLMTIKL